MKTNLKLSIFVSLLTLAVAVGCTKKDENEGQAVPAPETNAVKAPAQGATEKTIALGSVGEQMAFDKGDLFVKAGDDVTLTFKNNSTTLKHNWVLTAPGKDNDVGLAGIKAGEAKGFIPDDATVASAVLAHTKLVDPQGSDSVTFKAPAPGDYPYICTNAGHHTVMKGVLHSK